MFGWLYSLRARRIQREIVRYESELEAARLSVEVKVGSNGGYSNGYSRNKTPDESDAREKFNTALINLQAAREKLSRLQAKLGIAATTQNH